MKSNKFWIITFLIVLLLSASIIFFLTGSPGMKVHIYQEGNLLKEIDVSASAQPQSFHIESDRGYNIVVIETGRVRVLDADCPDMICVHQGWVSDSFTPIICLPNRLVIRLCDGSEATADAVIG